MLSERSYKFYNIKGNPLLYFELVKEEMKCHLKLHLLVLVVLDLQECY